MERLQQFMAAFAWMLPLIIFCTLWDSIWKLIGMWKAGRNNDLAWFICIAVFSTLGILPIFYILLDKKKPEQSTNT